jgi:hypothetical protein
MGFHVCRWWPLLGTRRPRRLRPKSLSKADAGRHLRSAFNRSSRHTGPAERNSQRRDNAKPDALVAPAAHPQAHRAARPPTRRSSRAPWSAAAGRSVLEGGGGDLHPCCGQRMGNAQIRARGPFGGDRRRQRRARRLGGGAGREWWGKTIRDISRERARALHTQSTHSTRSTPRDPGEPLRAAVSLSLACRGRLARGQARPTPQGGAGREGRSPG